MGTETSLVGDILALHYLSITFLTTHFHKQLVEFNFILHVLAASIIFYLALLGSSETVS